MENELKNTLLTAKYEIESLRRQNEVLSAKVEVMNLFACVLHTQPALDPRVYGEDISWKLQRIVDDMSAEKVPAASEPAEGEKK